MTAVKKNEMKDITEPTTYNEILAYAKIIEWLHQASLWPTTVLGQDKDFALNRADWWLGVLKRIRKEKGKEE